MSEENRALRKEIIELHNNTSLFSKKLQSNIHNEVLQLHDQIQKKLSDYNSNKVGERLRTTILEMHKILKNLEVRLPQNSMCKDLLNSFRKDWKDIKENLSANQSSIQSTDIAAVGDVRGCIKALTSLD